MSDRKRERDRLPGGEGRVERSARRPSHVQRPIRRSVGRVVEQALAGQIVVDRARGGGGAHDARFDGIGDDGGGGAGRTRERLGGRECLRDPQPRHRRAGCGECHRRAVGACQRERVTHRQCLGVGDRQRPGRRRDRQPIERRSSGDAQHRSHQRRGRGEDVYSGAGLVRQRGRKVRARRRGEPRPDAGAETTDVADRIAGAVA